MKTPKLVPNSRQKMDGYTMLRAMEDESARLVFFDPQYRAVLDMMQIGNEGEGRHKSRVDLSQMTDHQISLFMEQIERVLGASGHVAFWMDKFSIGSGHHIKYFKFAPGLRVVDLIAWNTLRFGLGRRSRGSMEFLVIAQKYPRMAKGFWSDNTIRDCWSEGSSRDLHPHAKPYQLTERIIRATTRTGDLVADPCAGSFVVLEACRNTGRNFMGCDLRG